ncbi:CRISPR-associated endoribonuclease Cas6 [Desulfohalotomaculum tongense]|uniref:CRISPR-associated endoribonuclease Cas6 n=1 Tax=Desulforadius tongensis TaxID=1216062 RepID=UPI00195BDE76|nr:CRISPR-associated endoribonuclease Cas6 [Desulforadius tongensis]MBM7854025.1 CRISPR-associated endoribonuclease Cas6 [Desulforadius tongensis]
MGALAGLDNAGILKRILEGIDLRLCLSLTAKNGEIALPIHYNRYIQAAIYENISKELAYFLHEQGFTYGSRRFKFFVFSRLLGTYEIDRSEKRIIFKEGARLYISSPITEFCTSLMGCMLGDGRIRLGDVWVEVTGISVEKPLVSGNEVLLNLISPVVTYSTFEKPEGGKYTCYYQPGEKEFNRQIEANLRKKYAAYYGRTAPEGEIRVEVLNKPQLKISMYKKTVIKGYICRLKLTGPKELLQVAVDAGIGGKNSQGYGFAELLN